MKKILATIVFLVTLFSLLPTIVTAQYGQYGGPTPSRTIIIEKMVGKPNTNVKDPVNANYVSNLSPADPRFGPGQFVFFKVTIQSTSDLFFHNVVITDFVPDFLTPIEGPGNFDSNTRKITFNVGDLGPMVKNTFYFKMQIAPVNQLPADKGVFCEINKAQVTGDNNAFDESTSQFCIEKQIAATVTPTPGAPTKGGVTTIPSAGPEHALLILGANMVALTAGLYLRKKI